MTTDSARYSEPRPAEEHGYIWPGGLRSCPCCGSPASIMRSPTDHALVTITCQKNGCILVSAKTEPEAIALWQQRTFRAREFSHERH